MDNLLPAQRFFCIFYCLYDRFLIYILLNIFRVIFYFCLIFFLHLPLFSFPQIFCQQFFCPADPIFYKRYFNAHHSGNLFLTDSLKKRIRAPLLLSHLEAYLVHHISQLFFPPVSYALLEFLLAILIFQSYPLS